MICKEVNYDMAMQEWANLLDSGALPEDQTWIARSQLAGLKAEKNMAYYLNARFGDQPELLVFNNLKVEYRGLTAQIDHLVLSRWSAYFIETKSVGEKININVDGQWARVYGRKYKNMESPLEQSRRHETILFDLLQSRVKEFMGKLLGMQTTFRNTLEVRHLVGVTVGSVIQGKGKRAVADHIRSLDQIPQMIAEAHQAMRSSLLGSVLAEFHNPKTAKRAPTFSQKELEGCCQVLRQVDVSQTPLEQVHEFIQTLPQQAAGLRDAPAEDAVNEQPRPEPVKVELPPAIPAPAIPLCPKCQSPMILRTASKGGRAGSQFYGCSQFPKCRGIINVGQ